MTRVMSVKVSFIEVSSLLTERSEQYLVTTAVFGASLGLPEPNRRESTPFCFTEAAPSAASRRSSLSTIAAWAASGSISPEATNAS